MPFKPIITLDPEKLHKASQMLCETFGIIAIRGYQEEAGKNMLLGQDTILDLPTGAGKTLAFWFALFYHWSPGNEDPACQKIVLVVGPLTGLMNSQVC